MKQIYKFIALLMILTLLAGCISIPIGDGKSMKLSKDGVKFTGEGDETQEISFSENGEDGKMTMTATDEAGEESEVSFGQSTEIPDEFPEEIPIPDDAIVDSAMNMDLGDMVQMTVYLNAPQANFDQYVEMYQAFGEETGYEKSLEQTQEGFVSLTFQRDNEVVSVQINADNQSDDELFIALSYRQSDEEE